MGKDHVRLLDKAELREIRVRWLRQGRPYDDLDMVLDHVALLTDALQQIADGSWNHGNRVPGLTVMEFARSVLAGPSGVRS